MFAPFEGSEEFNEETVRQADAAASAVRGTEAARVEAPTEPFLNAIGSLVGKQVNIEGFAVRYASVGERADGGKSTTTVPVAHEVNTDGEVQPSHYVDATLMNVTSFAGQKVLYLNRPGMPERDYYIVPLTKVTHFELSPDQAEQ